MSKSIEIVDGPVPASLMNEVEVYRTPAPENLVDLRLDGTERSHPPTELMAYFNEGFTPLLSRYPSTAKLAEVIADRHGVSANRVVVTNGADEAISRAMRTMLEPGRRLLLADPTFDMLEVYGKLSGAAIDWASWSNKKFPVDEMIAAIRPNTTVIGVVSPNNPTGQILEANDLERLSEALPSGMILLDAVYAEYDSEALTQIALKLSNVVVIRSLSKAWALAGLRVGYALAPEKLARFFISAGGPYPVSTISVELALKRLRTGMEDVVNHVERVQQERTLLRDHLVKFGTETEESRANFVLARFENMPFVRDAMSALGIWPRQFPGKRGMENALRITCPGDDPLFSRLQSSLTTILAPEALLFDMDGVIADVAKSYRATIVRTVDVFTNGQISSAEVERRIHDLKNAGSFNNDWILTRQILLDLGFELSLEDVKRQFESIYQGATPRDGLKRREKLAIDRALLARLAEHSRLGIVTGRPRKDAREFLDRFNIGEYFSALVALEDAPGKPDPAPVVLALERLGTASAWMFGDTVDDIRAARAAGVLPVGVTPPGLPENSNELLDAGAVRVLKDMNSLEELLP